MNITQYSLSRWFVLIVAGAVAIGAAASIIMLRHYAATSRQIESLLARLETRASQLNAVEWQAMAKQKLRPALLDTAQRLRHELQQILKALTEHGSHREKTLRVSQCYQAYVAAMDEEFSLLAARQLSQARKVDEERVDPNYQALREALVDASVFHHNQSLKVMWAVDLGSAFALLIATIVIGVTFVLYERAQRAAQVARTEQTVLRRSEERFRSLVQNASDVIMILESDGTLRYVSDSAHRILHASPQDLVGTYLRDLVHPADRAEVENFLRACLQEQELTASVQFRHCQNERRYVEAVGNARLTDPSVRGLVLNCRDITERKQAEDELLRLSNAVKMSTENIVITDPNGMITEVNEAALTMFGATDRQDLIGKVAFELFTPEDRPHALAGMAEVLHTGAITNREYRIIKKDGSLITVEMSVGLMKDPTGNPVGFVGVSRDITERKRAEKALWLAKEEAEEANRSKSEFLATMSHELRTPLSVILGYTEMLLDGGFGPLTDQQHATIQRIEANGQGLFDLISEVLDLNRLDAGRMSLELTTVQIPQVFAEVEAETQGVRDLSKLAFLWRVEEGAPPLYTDPAKLKVILKNLVNNAVKFTQTGSVSVEARNHQGGVEISVRDTGRGIPVEQQEKIFEAFQQGKGNSREGYGGVGLGLHIVKRFLELLGGAITVESEVGRGSIFRVWLPQLERQYASNAQAPE